MGPAVILYTGVVLLVAVVAAAAGSVAARRLAFLYLAAQLAALAGGGAHFAGPTLAYALPDLLLLLGILWVAFQAPQSWPMACAVLQLVTVFGHLARMRDPTVMPLAYAIMIQWTAWPAAAVLMAGISLDRRAGRT